MKQSQELLDRSNCVLVVVDVQEKLLKAMWEKERVLENVTRLVKFAGIAGMPVVFTEQEKLGPTVEPLREVAPSYEPITKITFNCFGSTEFQPRLQELGGNTLLITGIEAHICVCQTALQALGSYRVQVVGDAISSRVEYNHRVAQERMSRAGVVITSTEMAIYELLGQAGTEEFKATLPLVK